MRPAFSVVFLTTLIGVGQGMLVALVTGQWYFVIGAAPSQEGGLFYAFGSLAALAFLGLGLFASFFHLANPQRAWRSAARWRTSWLSREVVALPAVMGLGILYGAVHWLGLKPVLWTFSNQKSLDLTMAVGFLVVGAALLLYVCTGMIYACVKFVREWASFWTVINYTLMGLASGFTLAAGFAAVMDSRLEEFLIGDALTLTLAAMATRAFQFWRNGRLRQPSTLKSAIGVHHQQIRQLTRGFLAEAFNTKEFFQPCTRQTLKGMAAFALFFGFALPAMLLVAAWIKNETPFLAMAFLSQYLGLLVERWVFFAQGNHVQNLYYQRAA
ncbi:MAG: dimethyl sulfoxide reductase anchor subunit family protein [Solirubrobacterales bacterium]